MSQVSTAVGGGSVVLVLAAVCAALSVLLLVPGRSVAPGDRRGGAPAAPRDAGWMRRHRLLIAPSAGLAVGLFLGGPLAPLAFLAGSLGAWVVLGRVESPGARHERDQIRRELPHVVSLLATALRAGTAPGPAIALVHQALPGPATERLERVRSLLLLGADPAETWAELASTSDGLAPLARTMSRAQRSGAPVTDAVEALADSLAARARAEIEDRARAVGVKAALPLGLCLLPAFVLIGIVPVVAGLLGEIAW